MPDFRYTLTFVDYYQRPSTRTFYTTVADYATARAAADALLVDAQALSTAHIVKDELTEVSDIAGAAAASSNVDEGLTLQYNLGGVKRASQNIPSPVKTIFLADGSADTGNVLITAWTANFLTGGWTISDGETPVSVLKGALDR